MFSRQGESFGYIGDHIGSNLKPWIMNQSKWAILPATLYVVLEFVSLYFQKKLHTFSFTKYFLKIHTFFVRFPPVLLTSNVMWNSATNRASMQ